MADETTEMALQFPGVTAAVVYDTTETTQKIIDDICRAAREVPQDLTTAAGRKQIASTAAKVARFKVYFDGMGKELVSGWKSKSKAVDANRKLLRDALDALKAEIRKPLTDLEELEAQAYELVKSLTEDIRRTADPADENGVAYSSAVLKSKRDAISKPLDPEVYGDSLSTAALVQKKALADLDVLIPKREKEEADAAELETRRQADLKDEQEKRDAKIRKEAAKTERDRLAKKQEKEDADKAKREANQEHRTAVTASAERALVDTCILTDVQAVKVVIAIVGGKIPGVSIQF